jgi:DNA-binding MarR family transcriptional regulator
MARGHRFAELVSQLAREITLRQASDVCCGELTLEQFQTLRTVEASDQLSIGSLSTRLRVDFSTMSRNVSLLERNGYLARSRNAEDGRVVQVGITAKGRRALDTLQCDEREILADVYDRLPPGERQTVIKALEILRTCLDESNGAEGGCCPPSASGKRASS